MAPQRRTKRARNGQAKFSSDVAPEGDGNTNSPSSASKTKQDTAKKIWMFTLKGENIQNSSIAPWIEQHCEEATWQREAGTEGGYEHWQMTVKLKNKNRLTWIKRHFHNAAHAEVVNNIDAAFNYTSKNDTRIEGPYFWPQPIEETYDHFVLEGYDKNPRPFQTEIIEVIKNHDPRAWMRYIYWYWSNNGNLGKSIFCRHLILKYGAYCVQGKQADVLYALSTTKPKIIVCNFPRCAEGREQPYAWIEQCLDGFFCSTKYKSGMCVFNPPCIIVFANFEPDLRQLSADRWKVTQVDE